MTVDGVIRSIGPDALNRDGNTMMYVGRRKQEKSAGQGTHAVSSVKNLHAYLIRCRLIMMSKGP